MAKKPLTAMSKQELIEENKLLSKQFKELSTQKTSQKTGRLKKWLKAGTIFLLVVVATLSFVALNLSFWVKRTITNTDQFVATTQPLISEPAITENISSKLTQELFSNIDVEARLQQNLPENIQFLAGPLSSQIEGFTKSQINKTLQSDQAQQIWTEILRTSQSTIIAYLRNDANSGVITVNSLYNYANQNLDNSQISFLLNKNIPPKIGNIQLAEIKAVPQARTYLKYIERTPQVIALLLIVTIALAILLSKNKRKTGIIMVSILFITSLFMLLSVKIGADQVSSLAKPENKDAAIAIYNTFSKSMISQTQGLIWLLGAVLLAFIVTSKSAISLKMKTIFRTNTDKALGKILPQFKAPNILLTIEQNRFIVELALVIGCFIGFGLRIPPTKQGMINSIISSVIAIITVEIIGSTARVRNHQKP